MRRVEFNVIALLIPLCGLSGAITQTSPNCLARLLKNKMPGAVMPSSLVMSMSFLSDMRLKDSKIVGMRWKVRGTKGIRRQYKYKESFEVYLWRWIWKSY